MLYWTTILIDRGNRGKSMINILDSHFLRCLPFRALAKRKIRLLIPSTDSCLASGRNKTAVPYISRLRNRLWVKRAFLTILVIFLCPLAHSEETYFRDLKVKSSPTIVSNGSLMSFLARGRLSISSERIGCVLSSGYWEISVTEYVSWSSVNYGKFQESFFSRKRPGSYGTSVFGVRTKDIEDFRLLKDAMEKFTVESEHRKLAAKELEKQSRLQEIGNLFTTEIDPPSADELYPGAFERRGYKLGMTITTFINTPFPDEDAWPGASPYFSGQRVVRDDFSLSDAMLHDEDWRAVGVIKSKFYWVSDTVYKYLGAGPLLAGTGANTTFYFIAPDREKEPRLFLIDTGNPSDRYDHLKQLYITALGEEPTVITENVQNKLGAVFLNETSMWVNDVSSLTLSKYGDTLNVLQIRHVNLPLFKVFEDRLQDVRAKKDPQL